MKNVREGYIDEYLDPETETTLTWWRTDTGRGYARMGAHVTLVTQWPSPRLPQLTWVLVLEVDSVIPPTYENGEGSARGAGIAF